MKCRPIMLAILLAVVTVACAQETTVKGRVFLDADGDGIPDSGETGLAGVTVCNGQKLVKTDADGRFQIAAGKPGAHDEKVFVFVILPEGYRPTKRWYVQTPTEKPAHFGLRTFPQGKTADFCFAHLSDTQVGGSDQGVGVAMEELALLDIKPAFVLNTGDLINHRLTSWPTYERLVAEAKLPLINTRGNHDPQYDLHFGPTAFAFDSNGLRFVSYYKSRGIASFLKKLCKDLPKGMRVVELSHFPTKPNSPRPFPRVLFHLSGDSHINMIRQGKDGFMAIRTTSYSYRKRDTAPVGYRIIEIKNGKFDTYFRPAGFKKLLAAAMPSEGGVYRPGKLPVQVNAYSGTSTPASVEVAYGSSAAPPTTGWVALDKEGVFAWSGELDTTSVTGPQKLHIRVTTVGGQKWTAVQSFTLAAGPPLVASPGKGSWPCYRYNSSVAKDATLAPPLQVAWCARIGGVIENVSPVVADGKIIQCASWDSPEEFKGAVCLDAKTGLQLWRKELAAAVKCSPATDGKAVFVATDDGVLQALSLVYGKELWRAERVCGERTPPPVYISSDGSKVYAAKGKSAWKVFDSVKGNEIGSVGRKKLPEAKSAYSASIKALLHKGSPWRKKIIGKDHQFLGQKLAGIAVAGKIGFIAMGNGKVAAISIPSGKVLWSIEMGTPFIAPPIVVGEALYVAGYNGYLYALTPRSK